MKTSTKLLIALLVCVPLSMVAYGYLLKQQFNEGNFYRKIFTDHPKYVFKSLAPFKHVVVDGSFYVAEESSLTRDPKIEIEQFIGTRTTAIGNGQLIEFANTQKEIGYSVLAGYEDIVKTKIKNDTLYISLFKLNGKGLNVERNVTFLSINNGNLKSLNLRTAHYKLNKISGKNLSVKVKDAKLSMVGVSFDSLTVFADHANSIDMDSSSINLFQYSLQNTSILNLATNEIQKFQRLNVDSLSEIAVKGKASQMEKFLPALSQ